MRAGIDGLGHLFIDGPVTPYIVADIAGAGTFVIPTLTVLSSATGHAGARFAADERVSSKLSTQWLDALRGCMNVYPQGDLDDALGAVAAASCCSCSGRASPARRSQWASSSPSAPGKDWPPPFELRAFSLCFYCAEGAYPAL